MKKLLQFKKQMLLAAVMIFSVYFVEAQLLCQANFTKTINQSTKTVTFTNTSTQGNFFYLWSFGDGTSSTQMNPVKTYASNGYFNVCLSILKSDSTCTSSRCDTVFLSGSNNTPTCNAAWTKTSVPNNILKYYFTAALNDTNFRYLWTFGDGTSSDSRVTYHIYSHTGSFNVCLKVSKKDSSCTQTICDTLRISASNSPGCNAAWTKYADQSNYLKYYFNATLNDTNFRYLWTFGDGTSSDNRVPNHIYNHTGNFVVCLKVSKKDSSCTQTLCDTIKIHAPTLPTCNAAWTKTSVPGTILNYYFTATLNDTNFRYLWTFGDGTSSDSRVTYHNYSHTGNYYVCLRVTKKDSSCTQTICDTLRIGNSNNPVCNPTWSKQADPNNNKKFYFTAALNDTNYRYLWTFGDGTSSDARVTYHTWVNHGKYKVCLKVFKKDSSCQNTLCDSISVGSSPCNPAFTKIISNSLPKTYSFEANTNDTNFYYRYTFGDGSSGLGRFQTHTYATIGTYTVCLTVTKKDSSCSQTYCQSLTISSQNSPCNANFNVFKSDSVGSNPHYVRFTNTSTGTYTRTIYTFGDGTSSDNPNPIHYFNSLGSHTVCLTIYNIVNHDTLCRSTTCRTFTIGNTNNNPATCVAVFGYERIGLSSIFRFVNHSQGQPLLYRWVFDGHATRTTTNVEFDFVTPGVHLACLTVTNALDTNCSNTYCTYVLFAGPSQQSGCLAEYEMIADPNDPATFQFNSLAGSNVSNSWNFGDGSTSTDPNATHTYLQNGKYFVCLSVLNFTDSCSDMRCDSVQVSTVTQIEESGMNLNSVYPVPAGDKLNIDIHSGLNQNSEIRIIDLTGKIIQTNKVQIHSGFNSLQVNLESLPQGIYFLQIQSEEQQITRKFVK